MTDTRARPAPKDALLVWFASILRHSDIHIRILGIATVFFFVSLSVLNPRTFLSTANFESMAIQISEIGLLTFAMALAMLIGGIDLSITATANLSAILAGLSMNAMVANGVSPVVASVVGALIGLASGTILGFINGILIAYGRVIPILATIATFMLYGGVGSVLTNGKSIYGFPDEVLAVGGASIAYVPVPLLILIACVVVLWVILNRTPFGLRLRLVGANPRASAFVGINNRRTVITIHSMTGTLAALAGFISLTRTDSANAQYGSSYVLMTILIAVLGGVSIFGGKGRIGGIALALVLFQFLGSGMNMLLVGVTRGNFFQNIIWGLLLLGVLSTTMLSTARTVRRSGVQGKTGDPDPTDVPAQERHKSIRE